MPNIQLSNLLSAERLIGEAIEALKTPGEEAICEQKLERALKWIDLELNRKRAELKGRADHD